MKIKRFFILSTLGIISFVNINCSNINQTQSMQSKKTKTVTWKMPKLNKLLLGSIIFFGNIYTGNCSSLYYKQENNNVPTNSNFNDIESNDFKTKYCNSINKNINEDTLKLFNALNILNTKNVNGEPPLHTAIKNGDTEKAMLLICMDGIDLNIEDDNGDTPFELAIKYKNRKIAKTLIDNEKVNLEFKKEKSFWNW